jgi:hypothetical protein
MFLGVALRSLGSRRMQANRKRESEMLGIAPAAAAQSR